MAACRISARRKPGRAPSACFYTATIGSGALSPILFGTVTDLVGLPTMMACIAGSALVTLTLALLLPKVAAEADAGGR